jgi:hypothetical protein
MAPRWLQPCTLNATKIDYSESHVRMRLFARRDVLDEAEVIIRGLIELSLKPRMDLRKLATEELSKHSDSDLLLPFSVACRADLDNLYRTVH